MGKPETAVRFITADGTRIEDDDTAQSVRGWLAREGAGAGRQAARRSHLLYLRPVSRLTFGHVAHPPIFFPKPARPRGPGRDRRHGGAARRRSRLLLGVQCDVARKGRAGQRTGTGSYSPSSTVRRRSAAAHCFQQLCPSRFPSLAAPGLPSLAPPLFLFVFVSLPALAAVVCLADHVQTIFATVTLRATTSINDAEDAMGSDPTSASLVRAPPPRTHAPARSHHCAWGEEE